MYEFNAYTAHRVCPSILLYNQRKINAQMLKYCCHIQEGFADIMSNEKCLRMLGRLIIEAPLDVVHDVINIITVVCKE